MTVFWIGWAMVVGYFAMRLANAYVQNRALKKIRAQSSRRLQLIEEAAKTMRGTPTDRFSVHHCAGCRCHEEMKLSLEWYETNVRPDKDGDGVPDVFQRRRPLSEILEFDKQLAEPGEPTSPGRISNPNEYWIAVELPARPPRKHEYFILDGEEIVQSSINYSENFQAIIIKQTRNCRPEDLVELSK